MSKHLTLKAKGFTLVELMVGIAIIAILSVVAIPNLSDFIIKMRVDGEISELNRLLLTARNTAINTEQNVTVCPISGNNCAASNNWHGAIGVISADGELVKEKSSIKTGDKLQFDYVQIVYTATGRTVGDTSGTFSYCPNAHADKSRGIDVSSSGRTYSSKDTDNDGKDEDRSGNEITCS
mgnify:CR=1 FL=1